MLFFWKKIYIEVFDFFCKFFFTFNEHFTDNHFNEIFFLILITFKYTLLMWKINKKANIKIRNNTVYRINKHSLKINIFKIIFMR